MHDLTIRNAELVDGSGADRRPADITVDDGRITGVEPAGSAGRAARTIDADGRLVTPGWVDVHTHYDAQASWDPYLTPSSWHGVTSAVMGNCGVGFARVRNHPARPLSPKLRPVRIRRRACEGAEEKTGQYGANEAKWIHAFGLAVFNCDVEWAPRSKCS
jgi:N-acyl-D-aspartate/D-glutamate deacylase